MPRRRNRRPRDFSEPRSTRKRKDPRLTVGDVIFLLQPEAWAAVGLGKRSGALGAAIVALAATMRIGTSAARDILLEDWNAGNVMVPTRTGQRAAIPLPVTIEVVQRYIKERPANAGPWLFVSATGGQLNHTSITHVFSSLGARCRIPGTRIPTRCQQFFDRSFDGEDEDRAAVAALCGWLDRAVDTHVARADVDWAAGDPDRLRAVLEDNHELVGAAGCFLGARGMELAAETRMIFPTQDRIPKRMSPAMLTDPVCILLAAISWPAKGKVTLRRNFKRLHFDHLDDLRRAGRIRTREIAYLFSCGIGTVESWQRIRRAAEKTPERLAEEAHWIEAAPALYLKRPRGQTPKQFHARLVSDYGCTVPLVWLANMLRLAGALRPRSRKTTAAG